MAIPEPQQHSAVIAVLQAELALAQAELTRVQAELVKCQARSQEVHDDLRIEIETLDSQRQWLTESLDWYAELYEFAPIAYLALDASGLVRDINIAGVALLGRERSRMLGRPMRLHIVPADRNVFLEHLWRSRHQDGQVVAELRVLGSDQREIPAQLISRRAMGGLAGPSLRTAIFDLGDRKQAEADLQLSHQRLSFALEASGAGLYEYTGAGGRLWVSPRWSQIVGRSAVEPEERVELWAWLADRIHPEDLPARERAHDAFMTGEARSHVAEFRLRHPNGAWMWVRERAHAAQRGPDDRPTRVVGVLNDIHAEKQRLAEAERRTVQLRQLAAALFRVEENERRELATLMHDDLGQRLVAAQLRIGALSQRGTAGLEPVTELLNAAQETVRSLSFQLSPPILRDLGLVAGLQWLARELASTWELAVEIDEQPPLPTLSSSAVYLLFRCIRELLINVAKHAGVPEARVALRRGQDDGSLQVIVEDQGAGMNPERMSDRHERRSFGLFSVRERIEGLGGHMLVDSSADRGTRVTLLIPAAAATEVP